MIFFLLLLLYEKEIKGTRDNTTKLEKLQLFFNDYFEK